MRLGILGGTFDPIHNAHISVALRAKTEFKLDKVLLMVAAVPPHKTRQYTAAELRFAMVKSASENLCGIEACDLELKRKGKSYTSDTAIQLAEIYPDAELFFIVGADMLSSFLDWHEPQVILNHAGLIGFGRDDESVFHAANAIKSSLGGNILLSKMDNIALSATALRERIYNAESIASDVPQSVALTIYENGLYMPEYVKQMVSRLSIELNNKRFKHTCGAAFTAVELSNIYNACPEKVRIAAYLHDCARFDFERQKSLALKYNVQLPSISPENLLHETLGREYAMHEYKIADEEILSAIAKHTTGVSTTANNLTLLDKIVYVADKIEPSRCYTGIDELRRLAYNNIDDAVAALNENTAQYLQKNNMQCVTIN